MRKLIALLLIAAGIFIMHGIEFNGQKTADFRRIQIQDKSPAL